MYCQDRAYFELLLRKDPGGGDLPAAFRCGPFRSASKICISSGVPRRA